MTTDRHRPRKINDELLRKLWLSRLSEGAIAEKLGHHRATLRRRAVKLGLPSSRRTMWDRQK